jgi:hypothetical protein
VFFLCVGIFIDQVRNVPGCFDVAAFVVFNDSIQVEFGKANNLKLHLRVARTQLFNLQSEIPVFTSQELNFVLHAHNTQINRLATVLSSDF